MQKSSIITYVSLAATLAGLVLAGLGINPAPATPDLGLIAGGIVAAIGLIAHHLTGKVPPTPPQP